MTSLSKDRRILRPNRMKRGGHCRGCAHTIYIWFAVEYCDSCLGETTQAHDDCRRDKPALVRYHRYKVGLNA